MELVVISSDKKFEGLVRLWDLCDDSDDPESFDVYCTKGDEPKREAFVKNVMSQ